MISTSKWRYLYGDGFMTEALVAEKKEKKAKTTIKTSKKKAKKKTKKRDLGEYSLVVVESPSKAKTIKKYLGRNYQVMASNGHIKDLPKSKLGVDVTNNFSVELIPITGKKDKIEKIRELSKKANEIFLAPDPDREGEAIAFHIAEEIGGRKKINRVLFNAVTKKAVLEAMERPTSLDQKKYDSQKTRRILDRLVGYKISPILWEKIQRGLSAGRVQSVALRIIVDRENSINEFNPEQWFSVHAQLEKDNNILNAKYYGEDVNKKSDLTDENQVKSILEKIKDQKFIVVDIKRKERRQNPTPPFTTSKLQQEAVNKLGFTTKKTMMLAQKLYEGINLSKHGMQGLITYMRTDSVRSDAEMLNALREYIVENYGKENLSKEPILYKKKKGSKIQDAHEAIRPTNLEFSPDEVKDDLTPDELKLYTLIWNKFVSSQMEQAIIDQTTVMFEVNGHYFKAFGSSLKFSGFRTVYLESIAENQSTKEDKDDTEDDIAIKSEILPDLTIDEKLSVKDEIQSQEHWTAPPPRYSEATLVKELEEQGIGRPSTYASIISNILDRGYVEKNENRFLPTELGIVVCRMLLESFPDIMDIAFTAKIEEFLDKIEEGNIKWKKVLNDFWNGFEKTLVKAKEEMKNLKKQLIPTGIKCLKCEEGEYFIKWGRNGQFFACSKYPRCNSTQDFKKHLDGTYEIVPKNYAKDPCPNCGKRLVIKKGRYGRFLTCEEYPDCDVTLPFTLDVKCPVCKTGNFAEKKSRYGKIFYGCSNYPDCNNAMWTLPRDYPCPACGHPVMGQRETKRSGKHLQCPKCKHRVPLEETPFEEE